MLFCNKCKGYASKRSDKLKRACDVEGVDDVVHSFASTASKRLKRGRHPNGVDRVTRLERLSREAALWLASRECAQAASDSQAHPIDETGAPVGVVSGPDSLPPELLNAELEWPDLTPDNDPFGWGFELE